MEKLGNLCKFKFIQNKQNCSNVNISVNFKDTITKNVDHILDAH